MREPGIAWWPGRLPAGQVNTNLMSTLDLFPTALNLAGAQLPPDRVLDGLDMSAMLLEGAPSPRRSLFYYRGTRLFAAREDHWKPHLFTQKRYGQPNPDAHDPPLLFNLNVDPGESFNLADRHPGEGASAAPRCGPPGTRATRDRRGLLHPVARSGRHAPREGVVGKDRSRGLLPPPWGTVKRRCR